MPLTPPDAARMLTMWASLVVDRLAMAPLLPRVWQLRDNLTAHDAIFVAAAEIHDVPLVAADRRHATATGLRCVVELVPID